MLPFKKDQKKIIVLRRKLYAGNLSLDLLINSLKEKSFKHKKI